MGLKKITMEKFIRLRHSNNLKGFKIKQISKDIMKLFISFKK